jgi:hypothetical protein
MFIFIEGPFCGKIRVGVISSFPELVTVFSRLEEFDKFAVSKEVTKTINRAIGKSFTIRSILVEPEIKLSGSSKVVLNPTPEKGWDSFVFPH